MPDDTRATLLVKQQEVADRVASLTVAPEAAGGISFGKRVGDGTSIAVERLTQVAAHEQLLRQAAEVERALIKLDAGTYGICDACDRPIPQGRVDIHPWAVLCVPCASPK
ncbi:MAG: TraR/DksA family transcriptional regulator [Actinomycetales bacterium]